jgi:glycosyltransferase involved in cell wall biosynthesis
MKYANNRKKLSAIITTCERPPVILERAIKSVINQTIYDEIELIIVNDAPMYEFRDQIDSIAESYNAHYFVNNVRSGAGFSRNIGINESTGDYIAFLDDDDEWLPEKSSHMLSMFDENTGMVYCDMITRGKHGDAIQKMKDYEQSQIIEKLLDYNYIGGFSSPIIRRSVLINAGMMDEKMPSSQDSDLWRRIALSSTIKHIREPLIIYYISDNSITGNPQNRLNGTLLMLEKYAELYKKYPYTRVSHVNRSIQNYIRSGWNTEARKLFREAYTKKEQISNLYVFPLGLMKKIADKVR